MRRSELLQGIRDMKFISVRKRFRGGELTQPEAAELLGISDRTFRRWSERYGDAGAAALYAAATRRPPETLDGQPPPPAPDHCPVTVAELLSET